MNEQMDFTSKLIQVKCPKCGAMVDSQPSVADGYRKIIKCYGKMKVSLKTKEKEEPCNFSGFVKIEEKNNQKT